MISLKGFDAVHFEHFDDAVEYESDSDRGPTMRVAASIPGSGIESRDGSRTIHRIRMARGRTGAAAIRHVLVGLVQKGASD